MTDIDFTRDTEQYRRELLAHCYRMLGSIADAEDLVQETYLRAWRSYDRFEGRSSLRSWLYRIATNACLTALGHHSRRVLPSGLCGPSSDPDAPPDLAGDEVSWVQPIPDALLDPAAVVTAREGLRLALIASLQYLPPKQRAVLILRDVLAFPAAEVAEVLETSVAAVKSTLQRARARLDEVRPAADDLVEPAEPELRALLDSYIAAFVNSDAALLEKILRSDATLEAVPARTWYSGMETCLPYLVRHAFRDPGDWAMVPVRANGQAAAVSYERGADGVHRAWGVLVLTAGEGGIARVHAFADPGLVGRFGFPEIWPR
ncbi:sigma-70 family RNA polymerase sigma factor [Amycolatopsis sp. CA-230715]|uniref:sigma-70 family RNA polymerase sigma factor n=1 Tax=Amycolatopsis sp. CA-230715 TaxID=2745196 RepID=UPI001C032F9F|nr:sigma-70 family RNA polymerase sigma factor [Amycolatopsis sp. CA-230715]QWF79490.1 ECF RNA polymerase sigma factor SigG [Amycolatopsis sp. CA-230715]